MQARLKMSSIVLGMQHYPELASAYRVCLKSMAGTPAYTVDVFFPVLQTKKFLPRRGLPCLCSITEATIPVLASKRTPEVHGSTPSSVFTDHKYSN